MKRKIDLQSSIDLNTRAKIQGESYSKIKFHALFSILEKSLDDDRIWVSDFRNDDIFVTEDLHDVIAAYNHFYAEIRESA